jgi:hypothetical protein
MTVKGLEGIEQSLAGIAAAVSREVAARKAAPRMATKPATRKPVTVRRGKAPADDEPEEAAEPPPKPEPPPDPVESKLTGKDDNKE